MSEEYMELIRKLSKQEMKLIKLLVHKGIKLLPANWESELMVYQMQDGGMGSLILYPRGYAMEGVNLGRG